MSFYGERRDAVGPIHQIAMPRSGTVPDTFAVPGTVPDTFGDVSLRNYLGQF